MVQRRQLRAWALDARHPDSAGGERDQGRYWSSANTDSERPDTIDTYCLLPTR
jgi:hypothetical protein